MVKHGPEIFGSTMGAISGRRVASFRDSVAELPLVISSEFYRPVLVIGTFYMWCAYMRCAHTDRVNKKRELTINRHALREIVPRSNFSR